MHKPIHEIYHYGNDRREQDMTKAEFVAWFDAELSHKGVGLYVGEYPDGADVSIRRGNPYGGQLVFDHLELSGRLQYGWSTFTMNKEA